MLLYRNNTNYKQELYWQIQRIILIRLQLFYAGSPFPLHVLVRVNSFLESVMKFKANFAVLITILSIQSVGNCIVYFMKTALVFTSPSLFWYCMRVNCSSLNLFTELLFIVYSLPNKYRCFDCKWGGKTTFPQLPPIKMGQCDLEQS